MVSSENATEYRNDLLHQILDTAQVSIVSVQALYDPAGRVVDFRILLVNQQSLLATGTTEATVLNSTLLTVFPNVNQKLFAVYVQVLETGQAFAGELYLELFGGWYNLSVSRSGTDVLISVFININHQKEAELREQDSLRRFKSILDNSLNGTVVYEAVRGESGQIEDFNVVLSNRAAQESIFKHSGKLIVGKMLLTIYPDSHSSGLFGLYADVTETGQPRRLEHYYSDFDVWYDVSLTKLDDGCVVTFIDISDTKRAVQIIEQSNSQLQTVMDTSQTGMFLFSPVRAMNPDGTPGPVTDFRFTMTNRALAAYVGQQPEAVQGGLGSVWFPSYKENGLFKKYLQTYETGQSLRFDFHYNDDGIDSWLDIMSTKMGDEVLVTFSDYTPLKKAQIQLQYQAQTLDRMLNGSMAAVVLFKAIRNEKDHVVDFRYEAINQAANAFNGRNGKELVGGHLLKNFPGARQEGLFQHYLDVVETGNPQRFEHHYLHDGLNSWLDISVVKNNDGLIVTYLDITAMKNSQQRLLQSNENLERFAYVSSHDLQEPLRKILAFGDMLVARHSEQLSEGALDKIRRMQSAAHRMQDLISDLLTYSRVSSRHAPFKAVDLQEVLAEVRSDLTVLIHQQKARLLSDSLPVVKGDATQLRQLFQNLISNAFKFSRPSVAPLVQVNYRLLNESDSSVSVTVPLQPDQSYHEITVHDNGIGFEQQYAERIFEAFQRLHGHSEYSGTGIGLAIVKKVVENHQGLIIANSQPGEGATFRVYLPVRPNEGMIE